ncbi:MAG: apolipoprotein N-acyltransferase [Chlamydiae bacterium]|nr:apolipoprotein N-acyltransferase [Chlamydiota bacterium]
MQKIKTLGWIQNKTLFALSLITVAFSQPDHPFFAWIATFLGYALFFIAIEEIASRKKRFQIGFIWYFMIQLIQLSWFASPYYHGTDIYYPYVGLALWLASQWGLVCLFFKKDAGYCRLLAVASLWVFLEYSRVFVFSGFPFNPIGQSLGFSIYSLQMASLIGILGMSFWVLITNLSLYRAINRISLHSIAIFFILFTAPYFFGSLNLTTHQHRAESSESIQVALVQTGLYAEEKNLFINRQSAFLSCEKQWENIIDLLLEKIKTDVDLIVMPEATVSAELYEKQVRVSNAHRISLDKTKSFSSAELAQALSNHFKSDVIIGALYTNQNKDLSYNSAAHFSKNSKCCQLYHKQILVPLSEYLPLSFIESILSKHGIDSFFTPGFESNVFYGRKIFAPTICYEECFSHILRSARQRGAEMFVNLSNDVWFPHTRLAKEHFYLGRLRAVENGVSLVRACNTGVTAAIDPFGKIIEKLEEKKDSSDWLKDVLVVKVPCYTYKTLFSRVGNTPVLFSSLCILSTFFMKRKKYRL